MKFGKFDQYYTILWFILQNYSIMFLYYNTLYFYVLDCQGIQKICLIYPGFFLIEYTWCTFCKWNYKALLFKQSYFSSYHFSYNNLICRSICIYIYIYDLFSQFYFYFLGVLCWLFCCRTSHLLLEYCRLCKGEKNNTYYNRDFFVFQT